MDAERNSNLQLNITRRLWFNLRLLHHVSIERKKIKKQTFSKYNQNPY